MDVVVEELVGLRLEAGGDSAIERIRRGRPRHSSRRRVGGGFRFLNLSRSWHATSVAASNASAIIRHFRNALNTRRLVPRNDPFHP